MFGQYFNQNNKSLEFVLYNKQKHINTLKSNNLDNNFFTNIPITIGEYNVGSCVKNQFNMLVSGYIPAINVEFNSVVADFQTYKNNILNTKHIQDFYGKTLSGVINPLDGITTDLTTFVGTIYNVQDTSIITR